MQERGSRFSYLRYDGLFYVKSKFEAIRDREISGTLGYLMRCIDYIVLLSILPLAQLKYNVKKAWEETAQARERDNYREKLNHATQLVDRLNEAENLAVEIKLLARQDISVYEQSRPSDVPLLEIFDNYIYGLHEYYDEFQELEDDITRATNIINTPSSASNQ